MFSYVYTFSDFSPKADVTFKRIPVHQDMTAMELIRSALRKFGIEASLSCENITFVCT